MKKIFLLLILGLNTAYCLVPLEGLILGEYTKHDEYKLGENFQGIFRGPDLSTIQQYLLRGENLQNSCVANNVYGYINAQEEERARQSYIGNLQYIGLNVALRSIVSYTKALNLDKSKFLNMVTNLVDKSCSNNSSVYSKKLLRNNFNKLYGQLSTKLPFKYEHLQLPVAILNEVESKAFVEKSLGYSIRNFRALCSWDGDVNDYRLLRKYLTDRYTVSYLQDYITSSKIKTKVLCENSICREVSHEYFMKKLPRVSGSVSVGEDIRLLYCNNFSSKRSYSNNKQIKTWQKLETKETKVKEVINFNSLFMQTPNLSLLAKDFSHFRSLLELKVTEGWNRWASQELSRFSLDLLHEEALQIDLVNKKNSSDYLQGILNLKFEYSLGELDRLSSSLNRVKATFNIELNKKFIRWFYTEYYSAIDNRKFEKIKELKNRLISVLGESFQKKEKYFKIKMWTPEIAPISANEIIRQMSLYRGRDKDFNSSFSDKTIKLQVDLSFGVFALKYFRDKNNLKKTYQTLTSK